MTIGQFNPAAIAADPQLQEAEYGQLHQQGLQLAERWEQFPGKRIRGWEKHESVNFVRGIENPYRRALVGHLLEATYKQYARLDETTRTLAVGNYEKYVFPIIRMVYANLVAADLVSVQPLPGPTGLIFYYDAVAGVTKGAINKGDKLFDSKLGPEQSYHFTDEVVENESLGTGTGATANFTGTLSYSPVRPGTVSITDGSLTATDDGAGNLIGDVSGGGTNTVNYATGSYDVTFSANPDNGDAITGTYEYNMEANDSIPEIEIQLTSAPVVARDNKFRARWSMEAEQDLLATHGMVAETEFVTLMSNRIAQEINQKIIRHLRAIAFNRSNPVTFDVNPPTGVSYKDHKEILVDTFVELSNTIFQQTQRIEGTWLIVSVEVANIIETLAPHFVKTPQSSSVSGIRKIGRLGDWDVYKDPSYPANEFLMGHKGGNFLDTGFVHAVYQGLVSTPSITLDDFITRKGMMSRTAQKVVNENFYARGYIFDSSS